MNIYETNNVVVLGGDIIGLFQAVGQTTKVMQCLSCMKLNAFTECVFQDGGNKGGQTETDLQS